MRSRGDGAGVGRRVRVRLAIEHLLRSVAYVALAAWIWLALRPRAAVDVTRDSALPDALVRWTLAPPDSVHVELDTVPDARSRDWLAALRGAATSVSWASRSISAVALETYPAVEPAGGAIVLAAVPAGLSDSMSAGVSAGMSGVRRSAVLSDGLGIIDSLGVGQSPTLVKVGDPAGDITLASGVQPARATVAAAGEARHVLVAGAAGWEAKFIITALEEAGWQVDANIVVGPGNTVTQNAARLADTSRHAVVVLVDSSGAGQVRGVEQFVRQGGGLVLVGDANGARGLASLVTWRAGRRAIAPLGTLPGDTAWRGLTRIPLDPTGAGTGTGSGSGTAIALESRDGHPVVIARRHYAGRVVGVGYDETWRWRMAGGATSLADHRAWWSHLVASVALRPTPQTPLVTGAAPLAALHAELGPPGTVSHAPPAIPRSTVMNALGALALASLLGEWLLRRLRGAG